MPCFRISSSSLLRPFCMVDDYLLSFTAQPITCHRARESSFHFGIFLPTTYSSLLMTYFSFCCYYFFCFPFCLSFINLSWTSSSVCLYFVESKTLTGSLFKKTLAQIFSCFGKTYILKNLPQPTEHCYLSTSACSGMPWVRLGVIGYCFSCF